MKLRSIGDGAAKAAGLVSYLSRPIDVSGAERRLRERQRARAERFLRNTRDLIYAYPASPYHRLLRWAGCALPDLEDRVRSLGLEGALEELRDRGVYVALEELKCQVPIRRPGLLLEPRPSDFDNPRLGRWSIDARSSGSRSKVTHVGYNWEFFAEEAENELLLLRAHGLVEAPLGFWYPAMPSISGVHNLFIHLGFRRPPDVWFSQLATDLEGRTKAAWIAGTARLFGLRVPRPRGVELGQAIEVARWVAERLARDGACVLKTFASSAVRVARAAEAGGLSLEGAVFFTGGEPLTEGRSRYLAGRGVRAFPRYVSTETGLIAGACGQGGRALDEMHLYTDRLAVVARDRTTRLGGQEVRGLLFTTLSAASGKVLLNAELGDAGALEDRACACVFGRAGLVRHVSNVRSFDKLTGEGVTLFGSDLDEIIGALVLEAGGGPDDYQFWEEPGPEELSRLTIAVSPEVPQVDEQRLVREVLARLEASGRGGGIVARMFAQAGLVRVVRERPRVSRGFKMLPLLARAPDR